MDIPDVTGMPKHIAIIMDGNGRWAKKRFMPRVAGHTKGLDTVRKVVELCVKQHINYLTLFAFSSENWRRPIDEVSFLMNLFLKALEKEVAKLKKNNIRLKLIGDMSAFPKEIQERVQEAQHSTADNTVLVLTIAANYGGRWDVLQAIRKAVSEKHLIIDDINESWLSSHLSMDYAPEPDLFIRTGGEQRISNFLLWQLAYTELYFTDILWPDFDTKQFEFALKWYLERERRFGQTGDQLLNNQSTWNN